MAKKAAARKTGGTKKAAKRELIDTGTDKRFVRRGTGGKFKTGSAPRPGVLATSNARSVTLTKRWFERLNPHF